LERKKVFMYHYSMLLPKQVREKCAYYSRVNWAAFQNMERWAQQTFFERKNLFAVCNTLQVPLSWLEEYDGIHPKQVLNMLHDIQAGQHPGIEFLPTKDILRVIRGPQYRFGRFLRRAWVGFLPVRNALWRRLARLRRELVGLKERPERCPSGESKKT
jgi:hypothetical protein